MTTPSMHPINDSNYDDIFRLLISYFQGQPRFYENLNYRSWTVSDQADNDPWRAYVIACPRFHVRIDKIV